MKYQLKALTFVLCGILLPGFGLAEEKWEMDFCAPVGEPVLELDAGNVSIGVPQMADSHRVGSWINGDFVRAWNCIRKTNLPTLLNVGATTAGNEEYPLYDSDGERINYFSIKDDSGNGIAASYIANFQGAVSSDFDGKIRRPDTTEMGLRFHLDENGDPWMPLYYGYGKSWILPLVKDPESFSGKTFQRSILVDFPRGTAYIVYVGYNIHIGKANGAPPRLGRLKFNAMQFFLHMRTPDIAETWDDSKDIAGFTVRPEITVVP